MDRNELIKTIGRRGNDGERALETLFQTTYKLMLRYLRQKFKVEDHSVLEDVVSQLYMKVHENAGRFEAENEYAWKNWMSTIAKNLYFDRKRADKREQIRRERNFKKNFVDENRVAYGESDNEEVSYDLIAIDETKNKDVKQCIFDALKKLSRVKPDCYDAIKFKYMGMSVSEISSFIGKSQSATKEMMSQCYKAFRPIVVHCMEGVR